MNACVRFPLLVKVALWLGAHLALLALLFFLFVRWQLGLGLDSLLSGSTGGNLKAFGAEVAAALEETNRPKWSATAGRIARERSLQAAVFYKRGMPADLPFSIPANVEERLAKYPLNPPPPPGRGRLPHHAMPPGLGEPEGFEPPPARAVSPLPLFLTKGDGGNGYWAAVQLRVKTPHGDLGPPFILLIRSDTLGGSGMFFDFRPWLLGGLAVLVVSLLFWTPFVLGLTRYIRSLTRAADGITGAVREVSIPARGSDELGVLGRSIALLSERIHHFVSGQRRFLGDAAHELCAPLARIRTALGIIEAKRGGLPSDPHVESIEADAAELAHLVDELLAFSRSGASQPEIRAVPLAPLVAVVLRREAADMVDVEMKENLSVMADATLLSRAIGNLVRNAVIHAGTNARIRITATVESGLVKIIVSDDGPGVPGEELIRIFEPFHRVDRSRSRDTGGNGLGLAIVKNAIEACGGRVAATNAEPRGLAVTITLPAA